MTPTPYLLFLADLHSAAPGVLDVAFGADGDFEGAPNWLGPVHGTIDDQEGYWPIACVDAELPMTEMRGGWASPENAALDLRVPSVAARIANLCAQTLGFDLLAGSQVSAYKHGSYYYLATDSGMQEITWGISGHPLSHRPDKPNTPHLPSDLPDAAAFLAALCLALAPRIAALRRTS